MSTLPSRYQPPYNYPQQPTYLLPTSTQKPVLNTSKPVYTIFNKEPLQTIPLKEASILIFAGGALFFVHKSLFVLTAGKNPISHKKALLLSPLTALFGMIYFTPIFECVALWNFLIERKRRKALGLPTQWPTFSDVKESSRASWAGIKSLVSSSASSQ
jgi:hypothetical protein